MAEFLGVSMSDVLHTTCQVVPNLADQFDSSSPFAVNIQRDALLSKLYLWPKTSMDKRSGDFFERINTVKM